MFSKKRSFRAYLASSFNFSNWMGVTLLTRSGKSLIQLYRGLVTPPVAGTKESFTQAVLRLQVSERQIRHQLYYYKITSGIYGLFLLFGLIYTGILVAYSSIESALMAAAYCFLMGAFFFRESFWYMQIKKRKLGMHPLDWFRFMLGWI